MTYENITLNGNVYICVMIVEKEGGAVTALLAAQSCAKRLVAKFNEIGSILTRKEEKTLRRREWSWSIGEESIIQIHAVRKCYRIVHVLRSITY